MTTTAGMITAPISRRGTRVAAVAAARATRSNSSLAASVESARGPAAGTRESGSSAAVTTSRTTRTSTATAVCTAVATSGTGTSHCRRVGILPTPHVDGSGLRWDQVPTRPGYGGRTHIGRRQDANPTVARRASPSAPRDRCGGSAVSRGGVSRRRFLHFQIRRGGCF